MSELDFGWIRLAAFNSTVLIQLLEKDDFDVERDQPLFEYMFEQTVRQAVAANTRVAVCVDAVRANFVSLFSAPQMISRFLALVNKLHDYPETVGHRVKVDDQPNDIVSEHLACTAIVIESQSMRAIVNGIISVMPTRRPVEFFNSQKEALEFCARNTVSYSTSLE
jgi:hypothetical protein